MLALSGATEITISVASLFALLAVLAFARVLTRPATPPTRRSLRVGVFLERDHQDDDELPEAAARRRSPSPPDSPP